MRNYMTKSAAGRHIFSDWYEHNALASLVRTVYERDDTASPTGILDAQGNEVYAVDKMEQVGFIRRD